jgi:hypothetical protein
VSIMPNCPGTKHGTASAAANYKCKCPEAIELRRIQKRNHSAARKKGQRTREDATVTVRKLRALQALGYTNRAISEVSGIEEEMVRRLIAGMFRSVAPRTACRASLAYEQMAKVSQPTPRTWTAQKRAQALESAPPAAWDDITDPEATPVGLRETQTSEGRRLNKAKELLFEYDLIRDSGLSHEYALKELGVTHEAWWKACKTTQK